MKHHAPCDGTRLHGFVHIVGHPPGLDDQPIAVVFDLMSVEPARTAGSARVRGSNYVHTKARLRELTLVNKD
jgi:hypothetical protein